MIKNDIETWDRKEQDQQPGLASKEQHLFSLREVRRIIGYDQLLENALAWGELKQMLQQFENAGDKARYMGCIPQVLDTCPASAKAYECCTKVGGFGLLVDELLQRWDCMRSVESVMGAVY